MSRIFLTGFIALLSFAASSQEYSYAMRNYKAIDGLPQSQVTIILEDDNGYLWIGTQGGGLARFDGRQFKVYTTMDGLLSNIITHLTLDSNQTLWVMHPRGISRFNGVTFEKFVQPGSPASARRIGRAMESADSLFFLSEPGTLGKIYGDSVCYWSKPVAPGVQIRYGERLGNDDILLYGSDSAFYIKSRQGIYQLSHKGVFHRLYGIFYYGTKVWLATDKGHFTLDPLTRNFAPASIPVKNPVIFVDTVNNVFWTRHGNDLLKEKISGNATMIDTVLRDVDVKQVLVDSEGNTWLATSGMGLYKYYIQDFDRYGPPDMKVVMAVHRDAEGATWIGSTTRGLWKMQHGSVHSYFNDEDPYRNEVHTIAESPDHTVWVGTSYGLARYDRDSDSFSWFTRADGLSGPGVINISFDEKGSLYCGTFGSGLNYYDGKTFRHITMKDGLRSNTVTALHYSSRYHKLFIGDEFGLSAFAGQTVDPVHIPEIENTSVISIHSFRDSLLLVGSGGGGVVIYNPANGSKKLITTHHGLPSDFIYFVAADPQAYLWIGTEKGITRIRLDAALEITENLHYDYDNGLIGVETNQNAFYLGDDVKLFGLIDGLYQFHDLKRHRKKSFDLHLTSVELFYGQYNLRDYADSVFGFFKMPFRPQLPPQVNHVTFHYNRVDKRYPKSVKFRYLLENFDNTWSPTSSANAVTYSNLPPGNYTFRVMATDNSGSWAPAAIAYAFTIKAPFYKTTSFIVGIFILLGGAITLILYLRVKSRVNKLVMLERIRQKEQESLRKEIARDFHDEMGNQLTRIINYISLLKLNGSNGHETVRADLYSKMEDSAKYLYTGTRDFIWSIDPGNDELSKLFLHIRDFGEKLFEEKGISFRAFNEVKEKCRLPYGFSREANLIFKEAMTNAFKYSAAGNVSLSLVRAGDAFQLAFEDDGVGFYCGDIEKSNGLKNIRERADRIHAVLRIQSIKGKGTRIVLTFKINQPIKHGLTV